ncbi:hypothetical protein JL39_23810 [Rhizobium sp. YS-1r]|nr:hypothetical protein JL39_23810 [Rhizobium sp. YS-1r]
MIGLHSILSRETLIAEVAGPVVKTGMHRGPAFEIATGTDKIAEGWKRYHMSALIELHFMSRMASGPPKSAPNIMADRKYLATKHRTGSR